MQGPATSGEGVTQMWTSRPCGIQQRGLEPMRVLTQYVELSNYRLPYFKKLVLGCAQTNVRNQILVGIGKLFTISISKCSSRI